MSGWREADNMREEHRFQCQVCGKIHETDREYKAKNIYIKLWCDQCEKETAQLYIGTDMLDKYSTYNINFDERFYL